MASISAGVSGLVVLHVVLVNVYVAYCAQCGIGDTATDVLLTNTMAMFLSLCNGNITKSFLPCNLSSCCVL